MLDPKARRPRVITALIVSAMAALLAVLMLGSQRSVSSLSVRASYDSLHFLSGPDRARVIESPVAIVYLDLNSYVDRGLNPAQPFPRDIHAQLLKRLTTAGARAVVFDIIFTDAGPSLVADDDFAQAIRSNGRVILAGDFNGQQSYGGSVEGEWARLTSISPPYPKFMEAAAGWGFASQRIDDDFGVRRHFSGLPSGESTLAWSTARLLGLTNATSKLATGEAGRWWIRYYGPPLTIPHLSYEQALDPAGVSDEFFRGKTVFLGGRSMTQLLGGRPDEFRSPFHSWSNKQLFNPGVEVHATQLINLVRGDWLARLSSGSEAFWFTLFALLGSSLFWLRPVPATAVALGAGAAGVGLAIFAFGRGLFLPWLIPVAAQLPLLLGGSILFNSVEWYRTRRMMQTAKRIADEKIREQAALIDKAHDAILVQSLSGLLVYANPSAIRLYGWTLVDFQTTDALQRLFSADSVAALQARKNALAQGEWNGELRLQTQTGKCVTVASRWTLICDEHQEPKSLLMMSSDITEQKELEAQFLRTQRMNTIGSLAGGMAHDLNNALAPILMGVQLLRRKQPDEESERLLSVVENNTHRSADMVRQVLLFARGRGSDTEMLAMGPIVRELEKIVRETFPKKINIEVFLPDDLWPVRGNATQLYQLLLNLCVNARDAMTSGGLLSLAADNVELTAEEAEQMPDGSLGAYVSLMVSDTGEGMTPEIKARIFEPFFSTKGQGEGTGIGLATVSRIVKSHNGLLRLESDPGKGSTFEVLLPRAVIEKDLAPPVSHVPIMRGSNQLILIADDEVAFRQLVSDGLLANGYRVLQAANGTEAVDCFRKHSSEIHLLITDGEMPVMGGAEVIREIRAGATHLPVIYTSAETKDIPATPSGHAIRFLPKPFALDELLHALAAELEESKPPLAKSLVELS